MSPSSSWSRFFEKVEWSHAASSIPIPTNQRNSRSYWRVSEEKFWEMDCDRRIGWGKEGNNTPRIVQPSTFRLALPNEPHHRRCLLERCWPKLVLAKERELAAAE